LVKSKQNKGVIKMVKIEPDEISSIIHYNKLYSEEVKVVTVGTVFQVVR
jgi:hypothetical protein